MGYLLLAAFLVALDYLYFKIKYTKPKGPPVWYGFPFIGVVPIYLLPKPLFKVVFDWYVRYLPDVIITRFIFPCVVVKNSALSDVLYSEHCLSRPATAAGETIGYLTTGRPSWFIFDQNQKNCDWRSVRKTNVMALNVLPKQEKFARIVEVADNYLNTIEKRKGRLHDMESDIALAKLQETCNVNFGRISAVKITRRVLKELERLVLICPYVFLLTSLIPVKYLVKFESYLPKQFRPTLVKKIYFSFTRRILEAKKDGTDKPRDFVEAVLRLKEPEAALDFIRETVLFNMVASTHTTRHTTMAALSYISLHSRVMEKIQEELDRVVGSGPLTLEHLGELHYLKAAIHEACRLTPPLPTIVRYSTAPVQIGKYTVDAHMRIGLFLVSETMNAESFIHPENFIPDRYINDKGVFENSKKFSIFSRGKRMCPGQDIAGMSVQVYCAKILQRFDVIPERVGLEVPGFSGTLIPDSPKIPVRFVLREGISEVSSPIPTAKTAVILEKNPDGGNVQTDNPMSLLFAFMRDLGRERSRSDSIIP